MCIRDRLLPSDKEKFPAVNVKSPPTDKVEAGFLDNRNPPVSPVDVIVKSPVTFVNAEFKSTQLNCKGQFQTKFENACPQPFKELLYVVNPMISHVDPEFQVAVGIVPPEVVKLC